MKVRPRTTPRMVRVVEERVEMSSGSEKVQPSVMRE